MKDPHIYIKEVANKQEVPALLLPVSPVDK